VRRSVSPRSQEYGVRSIRIGSGACLQARAWEESDPQTVKAQLRPLRLNPETERLEEKGVDVALAACAFEWAVIESVDRVVIFSHDTDLSSIVEVIARTKGPQTVETASWCSKEYRKRIPPIAGVTNHLLKEKLFLAIEDQTHYGREARRRLEEKAALPV
jgi:NYN domain